MTDFNYDSEEMKRIIRRVRIKQDAGRDAELAVFRRVWEAMSPATRDGFKAALFALEELQDRIADLSQGRLSAPNVATNSELAHDHLAEASGLEIDKDLARLKKDLYFRPAEYLCAIACWEAGEDYVPCGQAHERWPFRHERDEWIKLQRLWDETPPAGENE